MNVVKEPNIKGMFQISFDITRDAIQEMRAEYLPLVVTDFDDAETIKAVIEGHKSVKRVKASIEARRKQLNKDALEWQRTVNDTARAITAPVQEIEDHLKAERDKIDAEKARVKAERERAEQATLQERVSQLAKVNGDVGDLMLLRILSEDEFAAKLAKATETFQQAEIARKRLEAELLEAERLAVIEAEKQAEQLRLQQAEIEKQRAELEAMKREQAERDKAEASRLAAEAEKQRRAAAAAREEELKPIKEQLCKLADSVECVAIPKALKDYGSKLQSILAVAAESIRGVV